MLKNMVNVFFNKFILKLPDKSINGHNKISRAKHVEKRVNFPI